ncbi:MAG: hypothetical protein ACRD4U_01855 [Candidatus Acidiferrales bacterium]
MRRNILLLVVTLALVVLTSSGLQAQVYQGPRSHIESSSIPPSQNPGYRDQFGNGPFGVVPTPYYGYNPSPYWNYMGTVLSTHIESKCRRSDGLYVIKDPLTDTKFELKLRDLQRESLSRLDQSTFIVGSRFETGDGTPVLVDFLLKPGMRGEWYVARSEVYKVNGEARYEYEWNGKKWVKAPAEAKE